MHFLFLSFLISFSIFARDLSMEFREKYKVGTLTAVEIQVLKMSEVIFIPGILSETFIRGDYRGPLDFSAITKDYFGSHLSYLQKLEVPTRRLKASSTNIQETITEIGELFQEEGKEYIFIAHSLGAMALMDYLLSHPENWNRINGIVFLQAPFTGAPMATVVQRYPFLNHLFPIAHTSTAVVKYLSVKNRQDFVEKNSASIRALTSSVRTITVGGVVNGHRTLFSPSASIIKTGCLDTAWGRCVGPKFYSGPFDVSDGMVPFEASKLPDTDFVRLKGVDHGETVVRIPYRNFNQRYLTAALLRLIL